MFDFIKKFKARKKEIEEEERIVAEAEREILKVFKKAVNGVPIGYLLDKTIFQTMIDEKFNVSFQGSKITIRNIEKSHYIEFSNETKMYRDVQDEIKKRVDHWESNKRKFERQERINVLKEFI